LSAERHERWADLLDSADAPFRADRARRRVLVVGDSLAEDLFVALTLNPDRFPNEDFRLLRLDDRCMGHVSSPDDGEQDTCAREARAFRSSELPEQADLVLISAGWDRASPPPLDTLLHALAGQAVVVFGSAAFAEMPAFLYQISTRAISPEGWPRFFAEHLHEPSRAASRSLVAVTDRHGARFADKYELFCAGEASERQCQLMESPSRPLLIDQSHVTVEGARRFGEWVAERGWLSPRAVH
jgi:hypothetical protein